MLILCDPQGVPCSVVALGMFDGVHLGHRQLLETGRRLADEMGLPLTVCTFEPHPLAVLRPALAPRRLTSPVERALRMREAGVDTLCVHRFTRELAAMAPEAFLARLKEIYQPAAVVCGFNFTFGAKGAGTCETLGEWGLREGLPVRVIPAVTFQGETVSSTRVRALLEAGDCRAAAALLGRPYQLSGTVVRGRGVGHTLGFPTANLRPKWRKVVPGNGVYVCAALVEGVRRPAVVNVGSHPTLPGGPPAIEAHLMDFVGDLYGRRLTLVFLERLRAEQRFESPEALARQVEKDKKRARQLWREGWPGER